MIVLIISDGLIVNAIEKKFEDILQHSIYSLDMKTNTFTITEPSIACILHGIDPVFLNIFFDESGRAETALPTTCNASTCNMKYLPKSDKKNIVIDDNIDENIKYNTEYNTESIAGGREGGFSPP